MWMYLGLFGFLVTFVMLTPQSRNYLAGVSAGLSAFMTTWAPFSYLLIMIMISAIICGFWVIHTWPKREDPENPMSKYNREMREAPAEDE